MAEERENYQLIDALARAMIDNHWRLHPYELHALGFQLRKEMDSIDCKKRSVIHIDRTMFKADQTKRTKYEFEIDDDDPGGVVIRVAEGDHKLLRFGAAQFVNPHGDDATYSIIDVAFSIIWPDHYTMCNVCRALILYDVHDDGRGCDACGADQMVCELGCYEFGGLICMHHGREMIPARVFEAHDEVWAAAEAAVEAAVADAQV